MVRIFKVNDLAQRKKILLVQSELHRQTLRVQVVGVQQTVADLKKRFTILGVSSAAASLGAMLAGKLFGRKPAAEKSGFFSKIATGISIFRKVKGFFSKAQDGLDDTGESL